MKDRPIFFTPDEVHTLLDRHPPDWIASYCALYETRMAELDDPGQKSAHLWSFMPPPAYEGTFALIVKAGERYCPSFGASSEALILIDMTGGLEHTASTAQLQLSPTASLSCDYQDGTITINHGDKTIALKGPELRVTLRRAGPEWHIAAGGDLLAKLPANTETLTPTLQVLDGQVAVVMAQSLAPQPGFVFFDCAQGERIVALPRERNPYRFEWGLRAIRVNSVFLMAAVLADIRAALQQAPTDCTQDLATRISIALDTTAETRLRYLSAYLAWPRWRPGVGEVPEAGAWDRNSFSNGVLASSVAILARLHPEIAGETIVQQAITARASAYFLALEQTHFLKISRWRDARWWTRRSANHGMIMIFAYLTATRLSGLEDSDGARLVHDIGFAAIEELYADGGFCEGIHYNGFALAPCMPYFQLLRDKDLPEWHRFRALLPKVYEWWSLSHDNAGKVFANFGDNVERNSSQDRVSVGVFLKQYADTDLSDAVDLDTVDSYSPFALLDQKTADTVAQGLVCRAFHKNQMAYATYVDGAQGRKSGLFVIGSRMQLTHNRNHDGAGFAFYTQGWRIGIDRSDRQPLGNNGVLFLSPAGKPEPIEGPRQYNGTVDVDDTGRNTAMLITSEYGPTQLKMRSGGTRKAAVTRRFLYRPESKCPLVLVTEVRGMKSLTPALAFNLSSHKDVPLPQHGCAVATENGSWTLLTPRRIGSTMIYAAADHSRRPLRFVSWFGESELNPAELFSAVSGKN